MKLKRFLLLLTIAALMVSAVACISDETDSSDDSSSSSPAPVKVELTLSDSELTLDVGQTHTVTATVTGTDEAVTWTSSAESVATVANGLVTAVAKGTATITAKVKDVEKTVAVTVKNVSGLSLEANQFTLNSLIWTDKNNVPHGETTAQIKPILSVNGAITDGGEYTYESTNENVATVSADGVITGVGIGSAAIEVKCVYDGETFTAQAVVTVSKLEVSSDEAFTFGGDKSEWVIDVERFGLTAEDVVGIYLENGEDYVQTDAETGEIIYDGNKAKVITDGINIDDKTEPDTVIVETDNMKFSIRIAYVSASNVEFVSETSPMTIGSTKEFKLYAFGIEVSESAEWSVDKDNIATVQDGVLTAVNYGTVKVTAKVYGYTYTTTQVIVKQRTPANKLEDVSVHNWVTGEDRYGYKQVIHGDYIPGDWFTLKFTPAEDLKRSMFFLYYGLNNVEKQEEKPAKFPNGCAYVFAGTDSFSGNMFNDSSFVILDSEGRQVGSLKDGTGADVYKAGETYTVFAQIPDDGTLDHDFYFIFAEEAHLDANAVMGGVLCWRDMLKNLSVNVTVSGVDGFAYNGETRRNQVTLDKKVTINASDLANATAENPYTVDLAALGVTGEVVKATVDGFTVPVILTDSNGENYHFYGSPVFMVDANGKPVVTDGKLTVLNNVYTFAGTNGSKTFTIETEDTKYTLELEIVPTDEKFNGSTGLIPGLADTILLSTDKMISEIAANRQFISFDIYSDNFSDGNYFYLQVGARHIGIKNNCADIISTWDTTRQNMITKDFIRVFDSEGNLVYDTVKWGGNKMFGTAENKMQSGKWYKVVIDMEGRAWGDDTCNQNFSSAHVMGKTVGMNTYFNNVKTFSKAEFEGITIDKTEETLAESRTLQITASLSELLSGMKVEWYSDDEDIATVDQNGLVTAVSMGDVKINATVNGKTVSCLIHVKPIIAPEDETEELVSSDNFKSWLPGTFDVPRTDWGDPTSGNLNPAYIPGEDFNGFNMLKVCIKIKENAASGYLHIYEYATRNNELWGDSLPIARWTVVGKDAYAPGKHYSYNYPAATFEHLCIVDKTTGIRYIESAVEWIPGHEYELYITVGENSSISFWYTSSMYYGTDNQGTFAYFYKPEYALNVLDNIEFVKFYGAVKKGTEKTLAVDPEEASVEEGKTLTLKAIMSVPGEVEWVSSNPEIATVDQNGLVTALAKGTVTITAKAFGLEATSTITVTDKQPLAVTDEKKLTTPIGTWLPGTFDVGLKNNDFNTNTNLNPAYIPGEDFAGCDVLVAVITIKEGATMGYLHINEYVGTNETKWVPTARRSVSIGKDFYGTDKIFTDTGSIVDFAPAHNYKELLIVDTTDNTTYSESFVEWTAGHTYKLYIAVAEGNSVAFWATSTNVLDGVGPINKWFLPEYELDVLENIEFVEFYGAKAV